MKTIATVLSTCAIAASTLFAAGGASAQNMTEAKAREIVAPLYKNFTPDAGDMAANLKAGTTADWKSCVNDTGCRGQEDSVKAFGGYKKLIPDMNLTIKELITAGDKIVVRSEMSGTPAGDFFGVPHTGKSFKIMTIDIHTVKDGKLSHTNHLEDWAGALGQLRAK